jgi:antitoxin HicB
MRYALDLTPDDNNTLLVTSREFPGATFGDDVEDALRHGLDLVESVLMWKIAEREPIAPPRAQGLHYVELPALTVAKVKLHNAMLEQNLRKADLVRMLGWKPTQVDRLLDLRHASRLDQLEQAFRALGKRLDISVKDAA